MMSGKQLRLWRPTDFQVQDLRPRNTVAFVHVCLEDHSLPFLTLDLVLMPVLVYKE